MQYHVYKKENSVNILKQKVWLGAQIILAVLSLSTLAAYLEVFSSIYILINTLSCIGILLLCNKIFHTPPAEDIYLKLEDNHLEYFSEEREEMIQIPAENITKIITRFCELHIHTADNSVHRISMSYIKKEQTRWEVKEMIKQLAHINSFSTAS